MTADLRRMQFTKVSVQVRRVSAFSLLATIIVALLSSTASVSSMHDVSAKDYNARVVERPALNYPSDGNEDQLSGKHQMEMKAINEPAADPSVINHGDDFSAQAALQIPRTFQSMDIVGSTGIYEVTFITSTAGAIDKIEIAFPVDTNIGPSGVIEKVGIGTGTLIKTGSTLTYDVQNPVNIPAGTFIRLEITGIRNPTNPNTFTTTITTMDSGGNIIDGPSQTNFYTVKQIGNTEIADNAVTTSKIADDAVTLSKIPAGSVATGSGTLQVVSSTVGVSPSSTQTVQVQCPPPYIEVGGIYNSVSFNSGLVLEKSALVDIGGGQTAWEVRVRNDDPFVGYSFQAGPMCLQLIGNP